MGRIGIRLRLTLTFGAVTAAILFALAFVLHAVFQADLIRTVDMDLRSRAQVVRAAIARQDASVMLASGDLIDPDEAFAQVLSTRGAIIESTEGVARAPMLTRAQLPHAGDGPRFVTARVAGVDDPVRLLAVPVSSGGAPEVIVVGSTLGDLNEALGRLWVLFGVFGAVALLLVTAGGWWVVGSALRPVERMRAEAGAISEDDLDRRLQVPEADDELSRLATTLNALLSRLEDAFRRKGEFLDRASHELRTPLSVLKMELDLAAHGGAGREELLGAIRSASAEADRLALLADDLLVLARLRDGRLPVRRTSIDVADLVRRVCEAHATRARAAGSEIGWSAPDPCVADLDPSRARQALEDLLDNAIVHGRGGPIEVHADTAPAEVRISVRDHGPGFPQEVLAGNAEPFGDDEPGSNSGLGLAIARAIAQAHGGRLELENERDGGGRATLVFGVPSTARQDDEPDESEVGASPGSS